MGESGALRADWLPPFGVRPDQARENLSLGTLYLRFWRVCTETSACIAILDKQHLSRAHCNVVPDPVATIAIPERKDEAKLLRWIRVICAWSRRRLGFHNSFYGYQQNTTKRAKCHVDNPSIPADNGQGYPLEVSRRPRLPTPSLKSTDKQVKSILSRLPFCGPDTGFFTETLCPLGLYFNKRCS